MRHPSPQLGWPDRAARGQPTLRDIYRFHSLRSFFVAFVASEFVMMRSEPSS
jgi:hypothetical protein